MKTAHRFLGGLAVLLALAASGCASAPSKISDDQIQQLQDKIDQLEAQVAAQKGGIIPPKGKGDNSQSVFCKADMDCLSGESCHSGFCMNSDKPVALNLSDIAGKWQAKTATQTSSSGKKIDLFKKGETLTLEFTSDGIWTTTLTDDQGVSTVYDVVHFNILSGDKLEVEELDAMASLSLDNDELTISQLPYGKVTRDFVLKKVSDAAPAKDLAVSDIVGNWKAMSYVVKKADGTRENILASQPGVTLTAEIGNSKVINFLFDDGKGNQTPYTCSFQLKPGNQMAIDKNKLPFAIGRFGDDILTFTGMPDAFGNTVDVVWFKSKAPAGLSLSDIAGNWKATSDVMTDSSSGQVVDLIKSGYFVKATIDANGSYSLTVVNPQGVPTTSNAKLSVEAGNKLAIDGGTPFEVSIVNDVMTWKKVPLTQTVTADVTWKKI